MSIIFGLYLLYVWYGGIDRFILTYTDGEFLKDYVFNSSPYKLVNTFSKMSDADIERLLEKDTNLKYPYYQWGTDPVTGEAFEIKNKYENQYDWVVKEFRATKYDSIIDEGFSKIKNTFSNIARADENTWYDTGYFDFIVGTSDGRESKVRVYNIYGANSRKWTVNYSCYILSGWGYNNHNITVSGCRDIPASPGKLDYVGGTLHHGYSNVCVPYVFQADIPENDYFAYWQGDKFNGYCQAAPTNSDAEGPHIIESTPNSNGDCRWEWRAIVSYANSGHQSEGRGLIYITMGYYFEPAKSALYIDTNGGSLGSQSGKFLYSQEKVGSILNISDLGNPSRKGYKFLGWTLINGENSQGTLINNVFTYSGYAAQTTLVEKKDDQSYGRYEQTYIPQSTLVAQWEKISYTVEIYTAQPDKATSTVQKLNPSGWSWDNNKNCYTRVFDYDDTTLSDPDKLFSLKGWTPLEDYYISNDGPHANEGTFSGGDKNLTDKDGGVIKVYVYWTQNKYTIHYSKNETTYNIYGDKVTTSATGTTNDTTALYDDTVKLTTNGYSKKGYIFKEWNTKSDGTGTGYSSGETLNKPNFVSTNNGEFTLYAIWEPIRYSIRFNSNDTSTLNYNDTDTYYQEVTGSNGSRTDDIRYDQPITLSTLGFKRTKDIKLSDGSVIKGGYNFIGWGNSKSQKTASFKDKWSGVNFRDVTVNNTTFDLYALWERPVQVKFNLNGGKYGGREYSSGIVIKASVYNDKYDYTFNILNGATGATGNSTAQSGKIHAYGSYDQDGINSLYTLRNVDGTLKRFLGWSFSNNGSPDENYIVYNPSRLGTVTTLNKKTNTYEKVNNLYTCWEDVLVLEATVGRTLGSLDYEDSSNHRLEVHNVTSANSESGIVLRTIVRPGEQGEYTLKVSGTNDNSSVSIIFEDIVTDIYDHGDSSSQWYDALNPISDNPLKSDQKHGLNRKYTEKISNIRNKWYTPNYFGTDKSYETSKDATEYSFVMGVTQPSVYYNYVYNKDESIEIYVIIDVSTGGTGGNGSVTDGGDTTLDELRTRLKIRLLD